MTVIDHVTAAELLFASGLDAADPLEAARIIARRYRSHPDPAEAARQMAEEYGDHPTAAAARMARCLALAPDRVEVPDPWVSPHLARAIGCDLCQGDGPYEAGEWGLRCPKHRNIRGEL